MIVASETIQSKNVIYLETSVMVSLLGELAELWWSIRMVWRVMGLEVFRSSEPWVPEKAQQ